MFSVIVNIMKILKNKKITFVLVAVFFVCAGAFLYTQVFQKNRKVESPQSSKEPSKATSEGSTFEIPKGVDNSSIKNYELLIENDEYKIRKLDNSYTITLYAIINRPDQIDMYRQQLAEYKKSALKFLVNSKVDIEKANIIYEPSEANDL